MSVRSRRTKGRRRFCFEDVSLFVGDEADNNVVAFSHYEGWASLISIYFHYIVKAPL